MAATLVLADLVVACTGSPGLVIEADVVAAARAGRREALVFLDLALPHDVDPAVAELPGVSLIGLADLAELGTDPATERDVADVRRIVADEVVRYLSVQRAERVQPTVVALRSRATAVADAELARLDLRLPDLDPAARDEVATAVHRVVDKLLHPPTVRMKEFAAQQDGEQYAEALHRLFDLDPETVDAVTRADLGDEPSEDEPS